MFSVISRFPQFYVIRKFAFFPSFKFFRNFEGSLLLNFLQFRVFQQFRVVLNFAFSAISRSPQFCVFRIFAFLCACVNTYAAFNQICTGSIQSIFDFDLVHFSCVTGMTMLALLKMNWKMPWITVDTNCLTTKWENSPKPFGVKDCYKTINLASVNSKR